MVIISRRASFVFQPAGRCVSDDGSYSPSMDKPEQALDFVQDAVSACGYSLGTDIHIALNCAASEFYDQVNSLPARASKLKPGMLSLNNVLPSPRQRCQVQNVCVKCGVLIKSENAVLSLMNIIIS